VLALQNPHVKNTPILSVLTDRPRVLARYLQDGGFMVRPIVHPTVPRGKERVRICVHAANTVQEVEGLFKRIKEWVEQEEQKTDVAKEKAKL
jgi:8-amino-7-oxononanoate synthase